MWDLRHGDYRVRLTREELAREMDTRGGLLVDSNEIIPSGLCGGVLGAPFGRLDGHTLNSKKVVGLFKDVELAPG